MSEQELSPAERAALAARGWYDKQQQRGERLDPASSLLYQQLGEIYMEEQREQEIVWMQRPIRDARNGDRIRMPGRPETERTIFSISPPLGWHVHPQANRYRPNEMPAEWSEALVKFDIGERAMGFKPDMPVEIGLPAIELEKIELFGWENRLGTKEGERWTRED